MYIAPVSHDKSRRALSETPPPRPTTKKCSSAPELEACLAAIVGPGSSFHAPSVTSTYVVWQPASYDFDRESSTSRNARSKPSIMFVPPLGTKSSTYRFKSFLKSGSARASVVRPAYVFADEPKRTTPTKSAKVVASRTAFAADLSRDIRSYCTMLPEVSKMSTRFLGPVAPAMCHGRMRAS